MNRKEAIALAQSLSKQQSWYLNESDLGYLSDSGQPVTHKHYYIRIDNVFSLPHHSWEEAFAEIQTRLPEERRNRLRYLEDELKKLKNP